MLATPAEANNALDNKLMYTLLQTTALLHTYIYNFFLQQRLQILYPVHLVCLLFPSNDLSPLNQHMTVQLRKNRNIGKGSTPKVPVEVKGKI
jgi:hypothetical protein